MQVFYLESLCFPSGPHSEDSPACCKSAACKWSGGHACGPSGCCPLDLMIQPHPRTKSQRTVCLFFFFNFSPCSRSQTLTLCDGKDQVPLLQEFPVQPRRPEEEVCDGSQTCPANGGLDVLLHRERQHCLKNTIITIFNNTSKWNNMTTSQRFGLTDSFLY